MYVLFMILSITAQGSKIHIAWNNIIAYKSSWIFFYINLNTISYSSTCFRLITPDYPYIFIIELSNESNMMVFHNYNCSNNRLTNSL